MNLSKKIMTLLAAILFLFINGLYAQPTTTATFANPNSTNQSLVITSGATTIHFNKLALRVGKNVQKLDRNTSVEIVKSRTGKILSVKTKKAGSEAWSNNVFANPGGDGSQEFKCNTDVCICSGLWDCIDMAYHVCSDNASPVCYDDDGGLHCSCVRD